MCSCCEGVLLLRNKRQKRLTRWRQLAEIASNLPTNTEPKAVASAQKLLQWIDKNKLALEQGMDAPGEELPGGGVKEVRNPDTDFQSSVSFAMLIPSRHAGGHLGRIPAADKLVCK